MKKISLLAATVIVLLVASCGQDKTVRPVTDPTIVKALASVNIDSVKTYIDELVALHTSHTLSAQTDPEKGIGAAVDYLAAR